MSRDASLDLLKKDARKLEEEVESRMRQFTKLTNSIGSRFETSYSGGGGAGGGAMRDVEDPEVGSMAGDLQADIETLLMRFGDINARMGRCIARLLYTIAIAS